MLVVNNDNFEKEVLQSEIPVLIDFYADWCMPCKMFGPVFESTAEDFEEKVKFVKINVEQSPDLARKYRVMSIPALKLVKNGNVLAETMGALTQDDLEEWIDENL